MRGFPSRRAMPSACVSALLLGNLTRCQQNWIRVVRNKACLHRVTRRSGMRIRPSFWPSRMWQKLVGELLLRAMRMRMWQKLVGRLLLRVSRLQTLARSCLVGCQKRQSLVGCQMMSGSCCISRRCISHSERSGVVDNSGSMADWTWKRHCRLSKATRHRNEPSELRPSRRTSGASVAQVVDEGPMVVMLHQLVRPEWWISS